MIHVLDGQLVDKGDLLVTLDNPELRQELQSLEIDIAISRLRLNTLFNAGEINEYQLEEESLAALDKKRFELEANIGDLTIVAPQAGQVLALELDMMEGQYFQPGTELLSIGQPGNIQAIALTKQADVDWVTANPNAEVELLIWGRHESSLIQGEITHVNPRARDDLPHESFSASIGGPLAVVPREQVEGESDSLSEEESLMLVQPRVLVEVSFSDDVRASLLPGQTGQLIVRSRSQNMGQYLSNKFIRFVRANNFRTHGL